MKRFTTFAFAVIALIFAATTTASAQGVRSSDLTFMAQGWYGFDIEKSRPNLTSYGYMNYEAAVGIQTNPENRNPYAEAFGFPMINIGFSLSRTSNFKFSDTTKFPDLYTLYGSFERSILKKRLVSAGYLLDFGITYNPGRYDPVNNPGNNWLSSPIMAYFGAGVFAKMHIGKRWEAGVNVMFRHFSNGRLDLPNEALNGVGAGLFVRYRMSDYEYEKYTQKYNFERNWDKGMQYMIVLGGGVHTCMAEWNAYVESEPDPVKKAEAAAQLKAHPKFSALMQSIDTRCATQQVSVLTSSTLPIWMP